MRYYQPIKPAALRQSDPPQSYLPIDPMKPHTLCLTGHRLLNAQDRQTIETMLPRAMEQLYTRGFRRVLCGGAIGFDQLAADGVLHFRQQHPDVALWMILPCAGQEQGWSAAEKQHLTRLKYAADRVLVLSPSYYEGCMLVRNRFMVDRSAQVLCYLRHNKGGTLSTIAYAMREQVPILNMAMFD